MSERRARAQRLSGRGVDLGMKGLTDEQAREAQEVLELKAGARCSGCGRRITVGFAFTSLDPRDAEAPVMRIAACSRDDCDFAEEAKDGGTFMEMVEFAWVDANGPDAPPALVITRARERAAAESNGQPAD